MKRVLRLLTMLLAAACPAISSAAPITFDFAFDNVFDGIPLEPPLVGNGQISFEDQGSGSFALSSLTNLTIQFSILGETFTLGDVTTPLDEVLAVVSDLGATRRFHFSNIFAIPSGPLFGSIDFMNANGVFLTFEPPILGPELDLYQMGGPGDTVIQGSYFAEQAQAVPAPGTLAVFCTGLGLLLHATRRR